MAASSVTGRSLRLASRSVFGAPRQIVQRPSLCFRRHRGEEHKWGKADGPQKLVRKYNAREPFSLSLESTIMPLEYFSKPTSMPSVTSRTWLRDACTCPRCVDPVSGQKLFATHEVPNELPVQYIGVTSKGDLEVFWGNDFFTRDTHRSVYPRTLWSDPPDARRAPLPQEQLWTKDRLTEKSPFFEYDAFMNDGDGYREILRRLTQDGILILRSVPQEEDAVIKMAARLGVLQETFHGKSYNIESTPDDDIDDLNLAGRTEHLHQDLLYIRNAPRIKLMHCIENDVTGGENFFSDGFNAGMRFRFLFPELVKALTHRKVVYKYDNNGHYYRVSRAVLSKVGLYWAPATQDPIQLDPMTNESMALYSQWRKGIKKLDEIMTNPQHVFEYKLQPGECAIFDNRRILHGRRPYDRSSGKQLIKVAYVEDDSFNSYMKAMGINLTIREVAQQEESIPDTIPVDLLGTPAAEEAEPAAPEPTEKLLFSKVVFDRSGQQAQS